MARQKSKSKEEKIVLAALNLVHSVGLSGLKMSHLASQCNMATGTLYLYFQDKSQLIHSLYKRIKQTRREQLPTVLEGTFIQRFESLWRAYLNLELSNVLESAFLEQYYRSPYAGAASDEEMHRYLEPALKLVEEGISSSYFHERPLPVILAHLRGPIVLLARSGSPLYLDKLAFRHLFATAWNGLATSEHQLI